MNQSSDDSVLPFVSRPSPDRHPDRMATLAHLYGMHPASPSRAKVLELGCSSGANLLPIALCYPNSQFIGIDKSPSQIEIAKKRSAILNLKNIQFECRDLRSLNSSFGEFDYIICHGLYSWVESEVRAHILRIFRDNLKPQGVAYLNYNASPGWLRRAPLKHVLQLLSKKNEEPLERVNSARKFLEVLEEMQIDDNSPYGQLLRQEIKNIQAHSDAFINSELLEPASTSFYFSELLQEFNNFDLQYLADVRHQELFLCQASQLSLSQRVSEFFEELDNDYISKEQIYEVLFPRSLRSSLISHSAIKLSRRVNANLLESLFVAAPLNPASATTDNLNSDAKLEFSNARGASLETKEPLIKAALMLLASLWPRPIALKELCQCARAQLEARSKPIREEQEDLPLLCSVLLSYFAVGLIELSTSEPAFSVEAGEKPRAHPFARLQSLEQDWVVNYRQEFVVLNELEGKILRLMDGEKDISSLNAALKEMFERGQIVVKDSTPGQGTQDFGVMLEELLQECLLRFGRSALLSA